MTGKKRYYKLDDIGFVGTQKKESPVKKRDTSKKTGDVFRAARKKSMGKRASR